MGWSKTGAFLWCGLLSLSAGASPISILHSPNSGVQTLNQAQPEVAGSSVWDSLSTLLGSLCFVVGCDLQRPTNEPATQASCELLIAEFVAKLEVRIPKGGYSIEQKLQAQAAIQEIVRIMKENPEIMSKSIEDRFRVVLEILQIELLY